MSEKEKRIREMSGESSCRFGESEQDAHRRTEIAQGTVLPERSAELVIGARIIVVL